jgi:GDP-mannose 6-dehydrogenase
MVYLVETLLGKGYDIRIYDENVSLARLIGANKEYIEQAIPHISSLLCDSLDDVLEHAEVLVVGNSSPTSVEAIRRSNGKAIIDLVRVMERLDGFDGYYDGICW